MARREDSVVLARVRKTSSNIGMERRATQWAQRVYSGLNEHGARVKQIVRVFACLARSPHGLITKAIGSDADRQSVYALLANKAITPASLAREQYRVAAEQSGSFAYVYVPVDGSSVTITDEQANKGTGPIGSPPHPSTRRAAAARA